MKKIIFLLLMTIMFFGGISATDEKKVEVIPTISSSGNSNSIALGTELVIASKFHLIGKWNLYGQFGAMYNLYQNKVSKDKFSEWQLGFEPLVGIGTDRFRVSGFLNSLTIKKRDTADMPFTEGGIRFSITPCRWAWLSVFTTWPISDPVLANHSITELSRGYGIIEKWAQQLNSYGGNIDVALGKKIIIGLDSFARNMDNWQLAAGVQYQLFKNKPWVLGGNVFYTKFLNKNYLFIYNIFPGMLGDDMKGYSFKFSVSNTGSLKDVDFSNLLNRISEPMYFSPVTYEESGESLPCIPCDKSEDCLNVKMIFNADKTVIKPGETVNFSWDVNDADKVTLDNSEVECSVPNYPIIFVSNGEYPHTLRAYNNGKLCQEKTITITVDETAECLNVKLDFNADKTKINLGETVTFSWVVTGADKATLDDVAVEFVVPNYPVVPVSVGEYSYTLRTYKNGKLCQEKTITITVEQPCTLCNSIFFHSSGSQTDNFSNNTLDPYVHDGDVVNLAYDIFNTCANMAFDVKVHWTLYSSGNIVAAEGEISLGLVPPNSNPLLPRPLFNFAGPSGQTYSKLELKIVGCTSY